MVYPCILKRTYGALLHQMTALSRPDLIVNVRSVAVSLTGRRRRLLGDVKYNELPDAMATLSGYIRVSLPRDAIIARYMLSCVCVSVCVCVCVCVSLCRPHASIVSKRPNKGSREQRHTIALVF